MSHRYVCPACGAHLQSDADLIEGDGERLQGAVQKDEPITCGTCGQAHPAKRWVEATRKAGLPVVTPEEEAKEPEEMPATYRGPQIVIPQDPPAKPQRVAVVKKPKAKKGQG